MEMYLHYFVSEHHGNWVDLLHWAEYWYNTSYQTSAAMTPFRLSVDWIPQDYYVIMK